MKKIIAVLIAAVMVLSLAGCELLPKEKAFSVEEMLITLTDAFTEAEFEGYTKAFDSRKMAVFVLREDKAELNGVEISLDEYAALTRVANVDRGPGEIKSEDGLTFFDYDYYGSDGTTIYSYLTVMYESDEAFWLVQFACDQTQWEKLRPEMIKYAQSVTFGDATQPEGQPDTQDNTVSPDNTAGGETEGGSGAEDAAGGGASEGGSGNAQ